MWGDDLRADAIRTAPGGKALNQAVTLARLGARVTALGCVGADAVGAAIRGALAAEGIDTAAMAVVPGLPTPVCVVYSRADGENAFVWQVPDAFAVTADLVTAALADTARADTTYAGTAQARTTHAGTARSGTGHTEIGPAARAARPPEALFVTLDSPEHIGGVLSAAGEHGLRVVVNPAPLPADLSVVGEIAWEQVDILVPNEAEARALLTPRRGAHGPAAHLADAIADELGAETVCVTLAERGCVLRIDGSSTVAPAPPADVVDTTAASDAFTAVLCAQLLTGASAQAAVRRAQHAAALTISRPGAYEALPTRAELRGWPDEEGDR
ncbi:PfkB family carbohydrate kinase [Parafrankia sp. EUN1f]|uniref:PfkB family carbohydrate kinase n=1 Tax=Parafrankia sp. EUN1f TaxID=102897 RepID=UPI0001C46474|nr:PfkB family carbohydrate kinase [Parafrankia sp. EUN1f]EFC80798.1 PfkB domain protein [Parafrankia sp. EUN1f]